MAEQLELFVQMLAAPAGNKKSLTSEGLTKVECNTDISLVDLGEWEAIEEEHQLDNELDGLRAKLKHEKAYNDRENQAHQRKATHLQQMLQKVKKEDAARRKAWDSTVRQIKQKLHEDNEELRQKLEHLQRLNMCLQEKLDAPALAEGKDISERLKTELRTLGLALSDEASKARLLGQELDGNSAIERVCKIEVDGAKQQLETLQKKSDSLRAAADERAQKIRDMSRQRDEMLDVLNDGKLLVRSLRCKYLVAKTHVEDTRTSRVVSQKVEQHPLLMAARRFATNVVQGI